MTFNQLKKLIMEEDSEERNPSLTMCDKCGKMFPDINAEIVNHSILCPDCFRKIKRKLNENRIAKKQLVMESIDIKAYDEVEVGDIGCDYNEIPVVITKVGTIKEIFSNRDDYSVEDITEIFDEDDPAVEVQRFSDGEVLAYVYDVSGVMVPRDWGNIRTIDFGRIK